MTLIALIVIAGAVGFLATPPRAERVAAAMPRTLWVSPILEGAWPPPDGMTFNLLVHLNATDEIAVGFGCQFPDGSLLVSLDRQDGVLRVPHVGGFRYGAPRYISYVRFERATARGSGGEAVKFVLESEPVSSLAGRHAAAEHAERQK